MSAATAYLLGFVTLPIVTAVVVVFVEARQTGRRLACDRHGWSSGPSSTRRWQVAVRNWVHTWRWHRFGQQPLHATDEWILDHQEWCSKSRIGRRGYAMARRSS